MGRKGKKKKNHTFSKQLKQQAIREMYLHKDDCTGSEADVLVMQQELQKYPQLLEQHVELYNQSPLVSAVEQGHELCVQFLLEQGADIEALDAGGTKDAIEIAFLAVFYKENRLEDDVYLNIINMLLEHGANANRVIKHECGSLTPILSYSMTNDLFPFFEIFLKYGADPNGFYTNDNEMISNIAFAVQNNCLKVIELLLLYGARTDSFKIPGFDLGASPIIHAIQKGHIQCLKLLLMYGISLEYSELFISHRYDHVLPITPPMRIESFLTCIVTNLSSFETRLKILNMIHKFGGNLWQYDENRVHVIDDEDAYVCSELERLRSNPLSLKCLSRLAILKIMGRKYPHFSDQLEIPSTLHTFLQFPDVDV